MRIDLVLELLDSPGQLLKALEPISVFGANLVTVIHKRDYKNENGKVPVQLTLEGEHEDLRSPQGYSTYSGICSCPLGFGTVKKRNG